MANLYIQHQSKVFSNTIYFLLKDLEFEYVHIEFDYEDIVNGAPPGYKIVWQYLF